MAFLKKVTSYSVKDKLNGGHRKLRSSRDVIRSLSKNVLRSLFFQDTLSLSVEIYVEQKSQLNKAIR